MATWLCKSCRNVYSNKVAQCPQCPQPLWRRGDRGRSAGGRADRADRGRSKSQRERAERDATRQDTSRKPPVKPALPPVQAVTPEEYWSSEFYVETPADPKMLRKLKTDLSKQLDDLQLQRNQCHAAGSLQLKTEAEYKIAHLKRGVYELQPLRKQIYQAELALDRARQRVIKAQAGVQDAEDTLNQAISDEKNNADTVKQLKRALADDAGDSDDFTGAEQMDEDAEDVYHNIGTPRNQETPQPPRKRWDANGSRWTRWDVRPEAAPTASSPFSPVQPSTLFGGAPQATPFEAARTGTEPQRPAAPPPPETPKPLTEQDMMSAFDKVAAKMYKDLTAAFSEKIDSNNQTMHRDIAQNITQQLGGLIDRLSGEITQANATAQNAVQHTANLQSSIATSVTAQIHHATAKFNNEIQKVAQIASGAAARADMATHTMFAAAGAYQPPADQQMPAAGTPIPMAPPQVVSQEPVPTDAQIQQQIAEATAAAQHNASQWAAMPNVPTPQGTCPPDPGTFPPVPPVSNEQQNMHPAEPVRPEVRIEPNAEVVYQQTSDEALLALLQPDVGDWAMSQGRLCKVMSRHSDGTIDVVELAFYDGTREHQPLSAVAKASRQEAAEGEAYMAATNSFDANRPNMLSGVAPEVHTNHAEGGWQDWEDWAADEEYEYHDDSWQAHSHRRWHSSYDQDTWNADYWAYPQVHAQDDDLSSETFTPPQSESAAPASGHEAPVAGAGETSPAACNGLGRSATFKGPTCRSPDFKAGARKSLRVERERSEAPRRRESRSRSESESESYYDDEYDEDRTPHRQKSPLLKRGKVTRKGSKNESGK